METLLDKAKAHGRSKRNAKKITSEDIELALAWLKGEVTSAQATMAYRGNRSQLTTATYFIALCLREAYRLKKIKA
jgi:hypothetical protein